MLACPPVVDVKWSNLNVRCGPGDRAETSDIGALRCLLSGAANGFQQLVLMPVDLVVQDSADAGENWLDD